MQVTWPKALAWVRQDEGGNDDNPNDSGGRTSRGITQREYTAHVHLKILTLKAGDILLPKYKDLPTDVWKAPDWVIDEIYKEHYWNPYCDALPIGTDYEFFDFNVNAGLSRAVHTLQTALHVLSDGHMGPITKLAIAKADPRELSARFAAAKKAFYTRLAQEQPKDREFLHGWINRVNSVQIRVSTILPPATGTANV